MSESKHTPIPWFLHDRGNGILDIAANELDGTQCRPARVNGNAVDEVYGPIAIANAAFIIRACNAHDDLLTACRAVLDSLNRADLGGAVLWIEPPYQAPPVHESAQERLQAAIAKAEQ